MQVMFQGEMHEHEIGPGPYDPKKPITCPKCIDRFSALKAELCEKYGWAKWPFKDS